VWGRQNLQSTASINDEGTTATTSLGERHPVYPVKYFSSFVLLYLVCFKKLKTK
jgi:hypothetical protein